MAVRQRGWTWRISEVSVCGALGVDEVHVTADGDVRPNRGPG